MLAGGERDRLDLIVSTSSVSPDSRCSSVSPTAITPSPALRAVRALRATVSMLSPKSCRRSVADERPLHSELEQHLGRDLARVGALGLPVDVLRVNLVRLLSTAAASETKGGQRTTSTPSGGSKPS